ncbi:cation/H(+) antiporter 3-like [Juglans microcarpa x Juglans regia]|uniref:cation/H(+) antiporter 3-like n=1 Tax=Juglans microcarpa x Juglans regia TaxID=2249226 RepID=UPI001B7E7850|nr:cation/H(+) antiporter 3-like [Juglans microcarpa x Juglans regia]
MQPSRTRAPFVATDGVIFWKVVSLFFELSLPVSASGLGLPEQAKMNSSSIDGTSTASKEICISLPPRVNSDGVWILNATSSLTNFSLPLLEMQLIFVFISNIVCYLILNSFGLITKFVSQMMAGILMGPHVFGGMKSFGELLFPLVSQEMLDTIAMLGYTLFLFLSGVKMDMGIIFRTGRKAMYTGALSLLMPLLLGMGTLQLFGNRWWGLRSSEKLELIFATATHSMTPFPVIACLLSDLNILNSELGRLGLSSAIVSDLFSGFLNSVFTLAKVAYDHSASRAFMDFGIIVVYLAVVVLGARPAMYWMVRQTPEGRPVKDLYIYIIILAVLGSALLSVWFDQLIVFGPFVLGLAVPDGPPLGSTLVYKLDSMVSGALLPLFVITTMMSVNFSGINLNSDLAMAHATAMVVVIVAKFAACLVPPLYSSMPMNDALTLALIMSCKGVVEMANYSIARGQNNIGEKIFSLAMFTILVTASIVPVLIRRLYDPSRKYAGYQKRNLIHHKPNTELRVLSCIHKPDNVPAVINLLERISPTRENPLAVYVLHLIELIGRASPVFISHQMQKKTLSNRSYSQDLILSFSHFQRNNHEAIAVNVFTAISPSKLMYEDICTLALDKLTSLIVLPFHRKYSIDGSIELEDNTLRTLNCSVLDRAPCSVAILVNRGHIRRSTPSVLASYSIAMIFLGGNDDREALILAGRMVNDSNVSLTVVRLIAEGEDSITDCSKMLDSEILKSFKYHSAADHKGCVMYIEEELKDGTETATMLRELIDNYDLCIVGRRYNVESPLTTCLEEWSEFPELGVMGDMLASTDFSGRCSVLVVQQQMTI